MVLFIPWMLQVYYAVPILTCVLVYKYMRCPPGQDMITPLGIETKGG